VLVLLVPVYYGVSEQGMKPFIAAILTSAPLAAADIYRCDIGSGYNDGTFCTEWDKRHLCCKVYIRGKLLYLLALG